MGDKDDQFIVETANSGVIVRCTVNEVRSYPTDDYKHFVIEGWKDGKCWVRIKSPNFGPK